MENIITLPVSELKTALTGLSKVVNKSSTLPVLQSIRVCRDNSGSVSLQGTDLDAVATYTTNQPGPACEFLVPLEALSKTVKSSRPKDSVLLVQDQDTIKLRTYIGDNAVDQKLDSLDIKDWPTLPVVTSAPIKVNGEFHTALKQAFECASEERL